MLKYIKYRDWKVWSLENKWLKLYIAPQLGGRLIQLEMDGYEFFFVNPALFGQEPDSTRLGENGTWLNFGGEKIWPAPQGWNTKDKWPGPPDPVLDSGVYSFADVSGSAGENGVILTSPFDKYTGLQIGKEVFLSENFSEVIVQVTFCNKSNVPREWSVWPVCQMKTSNANVGKQYQITCPLNPKSKFVNGYKVMHGLVNNPQNNFDVYGNLTIDYQYLVGKVGMDTNSNWIAYIDKKTGKVFVLMFQYQCDKKYPDDTSVQLWTQGRGIINSRNRIIEYKNDMIINPPYMEMELLSPLQVIQSGEYIQFEYRMLCCTIPPEGEIKSANKLGTVSSPLNVTIRKDDVSITGRFGVFSKSTLKLKLYALIGNNELTDILEERDVSPFDGIDINLKITKEKWFHNEISCLSIELYDETNHFIGDLDKILLADL